MTNTIDIRDELEALCEKYKNFDPNEYQETAETANELTGTVLDGFLKEAHAILARHDVFHKIDFIGMSDTIFAESIDAYFDIIRIEDQHLHTLPVKLKSK